VNLCPCFFPSRTIRGNGDDDGDGGGLHARGVIVGDYCGGVADVKGVSVADLVRGRDRLEGVHCVAWGVHPEIRSQG